MNLNEKISLRIKEKKQSKWKEIGKYGVLFIAPFFIVFFIFNFYPTLYTIFLSFTDAAGWADNYTIVGFQNFINLFNNAFFRDAVSNTFVLWLVNFIPQILLSFILAYWFTSKRLNLKGIPFWRAAFYLPNIITAASIAVIFYALFSYPQGPINLFLLKLSVIERPFDFFRNETFTRGLVSFIQFWMFYGQTTIVLMSGILSIDEHLFEAAKIDGANDWQAFTKITLPLLKPMILYVLITSLIGGLQMFDIPLLMTNGGPNGSVETIVTYIYKQSFSGGRNTGIGAAASVILLLITITISIFMSNMFRDKNTAKEE